uniref:vomeronasal type-2 receptor 116-like n=1 Tax=Jaculus jaculus TaxID=51337 RepID=UPI001E1B13A4|nr:vomeronasal type-2 receptor 116-like [Jaculus jaculus]
MLNDHDKFPYIYQMGTKDTSLTLAMVSLMVHYTWNWVGLVISDDDQGIQFLADLREEMQRNGICSAFVNVVPVNNQLYLRRHGIYDKHIMTSSANVIIMYGDTSSTLDETIRMLQYLGTGKIWVTTTQWYDISSKRYISLDSFHRTFTLSQHHGDIYGFKKFIQTLKSSKYLEDISLENLGWMYFNCSVSKSKWNTLYNFSSNISLELFTKHTFDVALSEESYHIYNAAYVVAYSLHELLLQQVDIVYMLVDNRPQSDCGKLNHLMKNIQFTNPVGDLVDMNQKRKLDPECDIFNLWDFQESWQVKVKTGQFSPYRPQGQQLQLLDDMVEWIPGSGQIAPSVCSVTCIPGFRKSRQEGKPPCCFDCIPCPENEISNFTADMEQCLKCPEDQYANTEQTHCLQRAITFLAYEEPLGMALACMAMCFFTLTCLVLGVFVKHHDTPIVRANNHALSYILLISLIFCFLCSLLFLGHPNIATCILQQTTFGVVFTVAISTILAKTITVVLAFKLTTPRKRMRWLLVSGAPNFIIPICILIQLILCGVWLGTSPPFIETDSHSEHGRIIIVCNKGSVSAFYCVLGFLGSLALGSFTIAFFARKLPDKYNEAKFLTFSMLVFCSVWVTFLPVYHSTKGKVMVAVEVFSILSSSAGLLGCIFVPKCYVIFLRPDRDSIPKYRDRIIS